MIQPQSAALSAAVARLQTLACGTCLCMSSIGRVVLSSQRTFPCDRGLSINAARVVSVAILDGGFTSIHDITSTSQLRKQWPFPDGLAKGSNRPFPNIPVGQKRSARLAKCLRMAGHNALGGAVVEPQKNEPDSLRPTSTRRFLAVSVVLASLNCSLLALNKMRLSVDNAFICR